MDILSCIAKICLRKFIWEGLKKNRVQFQVQTYKGATE